MTVLVTLSFVRRSNCAYIWNAASFRNRVNFYLDQRYFLSLRWKKYSSSLKNCYCNLNSVWVQFSSEENSAKRDLFSPLLLFVMIEINVFKNSFCFFWGGSVPMFITHYMCSVLEVAIIQFFFFLLFWLSFWGQLFITRKAGEMWKRISIGFIKHLRLKICRPSILSLTVRFY